MTVQPIGKTAIALVIESTDLLSRGITPEEIGIETARDFCMLAFESQGLHTRSGMELEMFPGSRCVLLFAKLVSTKPRFFIFNDFEDLISASSTTGGRQPSTLVYMNGSYILTIFPYEGEEIPSALAEYGREFEAPARFASHIAEHGEEIISGFALSTLRQSFLGR